MAVIWARRNKAKKEENSLESSFRKTIHGKGKKGRTGAANGGRSDDRRAGRIYNQRREGENCDALRYKEAQGNEEMPMTDEGRGCAVPPPSRS